MLECPKLPTLKFNQTNYDPRNNHTTTTLFLRHITPSTSVPPDHQTLTIHPPKLVDRNSTGEFHPTGVLQLDFITYLIALVCIMAFSISNKKKSTNELPKVPQIEQTSEWLRPLGNIEFVMCFAGYYDTMSTVQGIWIESDLPITHQVMEEALQSLVERMPQLSLSVRRRGLSLWFRKHRNINVDLVTAPGDPMEVFNELLKSKFDMANGPLWKARFVVLPQSPKGKYCYSLIFAIQHVITDGTFNMTICKETISILNGILTKTPTPRIVYPVIPPLADYLPVERALLYRFKKFFSKVYLILIKDYGKVTSFNNAIPIPIPDKYETKILSAELNEELTKKLIGYCKAEGVTVHAGIVAAANLALFRVAQRHSCEKMSATNIHVTNCINMRRHYPEEHKYSSGCHISFEEVQAQVSNEDFSNIWKHSRNVQGIMKRHLEENIHAINLKLIPFVASLFPINEFLTKHKKRTKTDCHYFTSNMGNLKDLIPEEPPNAPVKTTNLLRSVSGEICGHTSMLTFHTFRGRFMISLDYYTTKMSDQLAKEYFSLIFLHITSIAQTGGLSVALDS